MMKRLLSVLLVLVMVITVFGACAKKPAENNTTEKQKENNGKLKIITTIFPPYDFAKNIVSDMADVTMLLPLGS
ncbi:MAG: zinc ABC transporter substrate-binding protein, partial [Clostridiales bacterium]|nr:zinc ABC transporter substrate-binding protein [Clostridiales bacterium]